MPQAQLVNFPSKPLLAGREGSGRAGVRAPKCIYSSQVFPSLSAAVGLGGLKAKIRSYGPPSPPPPRNPHLLLQVSKPQERKIAKKRKKTVWRSGSGRDHGPTALATKCASFPRRIPSSASLPGRVAQPASSSSASARRLFVSAFPRSTPSNASCCSVRRLAQDGRRSCSRSKVRRRLSVRSALPRERFDL